MKRLLLFIFICCFCITSFGCGQISSKIIDSITPVKKGTSYDIEIGKTKKSDIQTTFSPVKESYQDVESKGKYRKLSHIHMVADASSGIVICEVHKIKGRKCTVFGLPGDNSMIKMYFTFDEETGLLTDFGKGARLYSDKFNLSYRPHTIKGDWVTKAIPNDAVGNEDVSRFYK